jgi:hypothetical protein
MSRTGTPRRPLVWATVLVAIVACSRAQPQPAGPAVGVRIKDFAIAAPRTIPAGEVTLLVRNAGPATHEFVVVRTDLPAGELPIGADGLSVNEEWLHGVGELDDVPMWTTGALSLHLEPGRYVFFCNLEGHYLGGMHRAVEVV